MSLFTPNYYSKSIYTVPIDFYIKNNFKVIFCDLDNTLEAFYNEEPSDRAKELLDQLRRHNIKLFVISNNRESRVKKYAEMLGVEYHHSSKKPFGFKLRKYIKRNNLNRNEIIMVGDQILTDVIASKNVKVKVILTEPLVNKDLLVTKINRFIDKIIRRIIRKKLKRLEVD